MRRMLRAPPVEPEEPGPPPPVAPPVITPPGGRITDDAVVITIEAEEGTTIEYRTDGVAPDEDGDWTGCCVYRRPLLLDEAALRGSIVATASAPLPGFPANGREGDGGENIFLFGLRASLRGDFPSRRMDPRT